MLQRKNRRMMKAVLGAAALGVLFSGGSSEAAFTTADYVEASGTNPYFRLFDTDTVDFFRIWLDQAGNGEFSIQSRIIPGVYTPVFVIENDPPENSLYIDSAGRVGLSTANPGADLEIYAPMEFILGVFRPGTATLRLEPARVCLGGCTSGTWDLNGGAYDFTIEDDAANTIPFRIEAAAPDDSLVIDNVGQLTSTWVGVNDGGDGLMNLMTLSSNNSSATASSDVGFALLNTREGFQWNFRTAEFADGFMATKQGTGGAELEILNATNDYTQVSLRLGNGARCTSTGQWVNASSRQYKENIRDLGAGEAMDAFRQLTPVSYNFKKDPAGERNIGFIAEDVPELIAVDDRKGVSTLEVVALLTKVVQEQQKAIDEQRQTIAELTELVRGKSEVTAQPAEAAAGPVPFERRPARGI